MKDFISQVLWMFFSTSLFSCQAWFLTFLSLFSPSWISLDSYTRIRIDFDAGHVICRNHLRISLILDQTACWLMTLSRMWVDAYDESYVTIWMTGNRCNFLHFPSYFGTNVLFLLWALRFYGSQRSSSTGGVVYRTRQNRSLCWMKITMHASSF